MHLRTNSYMQLGYLQLSGQPPIPQVVQTVGQLPPGVAVNRGVNTCFNCGNQKVRGKGVLHAHCPKCKIQWCLKDKCSLEVKRGAQLHMRTHFHSTPSNVCCHCGGPKVRGNWIRKQCPICYNFWCNANGDCKMEYPDVRAINTHLRKEHQM